MIISPDKSVRFIPTPSIIYDLPGRFGGEVLIMKDTLLDGPVVTSMNGKVLNSLDAGPSEVAILVNDLRLNYRKGCPDGAREEILLESRKYGLQVNAEYGSTEYFRSQVYRIYDSQGNYLRMLNRPPPSYVRHCEVKEAEPGADYKIVLKYYPDKIVYCKYPKSAWWYGCHSPYMEPSRCFPWDYQAWAKQRLEEIGGYSGGKNHVFPFFDCQRRAWICEITSSRFSIYKTDEFAQFETPFEVIKEEPLDGFGNPLENSPTKGAPPYLKDDAGIEYHFVFGEQDIPLWGKRFPVYDLWDYGLAKEHHDYPEKILGLCGAYHTTYSGFFGFFPYEDESYELDLRKFPKEIRALVHRAHQKKWGEEEKFSETPVEYILKPRTWEGMQGLPFEFRPRNWEKDFYTITLDGPRPYRKGESWAYELHPDRPDIIGINPSYFDVNHMRLIETGADTKIFVNPYVTTRMTLLDKNLPPDVKARINVYAATWPTKSFKRSGPMDEADGHVSEYLRLTETAPGSRRFANEDGSVVYELAYVMNDAKEIVQRPDAETLNYLYFYITDPKMGLNRFPQIVYETGIDTGYYRCWSEPPWRVINSLNGEWPYKPWAQVKEELKQSQFFVEVSGAGGTDAKMLRVSWEEPGKGSMHRDVPLKKMAEGKWRTTEPLLCFSLKGCDIDHKWNQTENLPTPQVPGVVTFRENNVRFSLVNGP